VEGRGTAIKSFPLSTSTTTTSSSSFFFHRSDGLRQITVDSIDCNAFPSTLVLLEIAMLSLQDGNQQSKQTDIYFAVVEVYGKRRPKYEYANCKWRSKH